MEARVDQERDWVFTVFGRGDLEAGFSGVYQIVKEQGMEFDYLETPERAEGASYSCARVVAYGSEYLEDVMREDLRKLADDVGMDIVAQTQREHDAERRLFVFDMDSTLIQGETIDELAKLAGVGEQVVAITASAMRGEIDFQESFRRRVRLLKGLREAEIAKVVERLPLMEGAERLFRELKARGKKMAVLSGGFTFLGRVVQERLGIDFLHANELDVMDAVVTGEVRGAIVDGARKVALMEEIAMREGVPLEQVVAVGDGANDLPMLRLAGMGVAFHAKPVVRAEARHSLTHVGLDGLLEVADCQERR